MFNSLYLYLFGVSTLVLILHIFLWSKYRLDTPSGAGIYLSLIYYIYSSLFELSFIAINYIFSLSLIFFLDDLIEISPSIRILSVVLASIGIVMNLDQISPFIILMVIFMSIILVNTINFYDGRDLNFATLFSLNIFGWLFFSENEYVFNLGIISLLFLIPFSIFNSKPNRVYIGDTGAFILAMMTVSIFFFDKKINGELNFLYLIPFILPVIDVFYVLIYRIYKGENLLSRNFYHLYQKDYHDKPRLSYLVPQILFYFFALLFLFLLQKLFNLNQLSSLGITFLFLSFIYVFMIRKKFYSLEW